QADAARFHRLLRHRVHQKAAPGGFACAAAERRLGAQALEHGLHHLRQEVGLKGLCRAAQAFQVLRLAGQGRGGIAQQVGRGGEGAHQITSISAWRAPAALMACRMLIMSRGLTPSAFRPLTSVDREVEPPTSRISRPASSLMLTSDCGTTTVWPPRLNGSGWLTIGVSCTDTVRLPCATATVEIRTASPMTMTPLTSSMMTLAGESIWTGRFSTRL